jgi:hypothetical protein
VERQPTAIHKIYQQVVWQVRSKATLRDPVFSDRAAALLTNLGYNHVFDYRGGKEHWKEGGLPVETSPV